MCGVVGLFVGCSAVVTCPRDSLLRTDTASQPLEEGEGEAGAQAYRSPFTTWFERSAVRRTPRRILDDVGPGELFPAELVPIAGHPLVRELPPGEFAQVLTQHAYRYLDFTAKLEHLVVNRTALGIAHGTIGVRVHEDMRFDAYKIYCDEAYHALFCADLIRQIERTTGVRPRLDRHPYLLRRLAEIRERVGPRLAPLVEIMFVICSETLISATLAESSADTRIAPAIRESIRDHALDEGRHHAYFVAFLRVMWGQLDPTLREQAVALVPELIMTFIRPDLPGLRDELLGYGLTPDQVEQVLAETYPDHVVSAYARETAAQTVRYFTELGAMDSERIRAEFLRHDLLKEVLV
ncbi:diiron oxygenase [Micromonospora sp. ALFpr18c]|uniref:diiron oxygenase n=1 Tax=Micromonospora sp. ALFpr18c TaxID=1458665 RepID=UPI00124B603D|nr:diiron oxygenase [Micromonospora sp. ALFpr18c]KAB1935297.1 diiron oxygenase [Micromonospora sp. ALFpr18c]